MDAEYGGRSALITDDSDDGCHDDSPSCDDAYVCEGRPRIESSSVVRVIYGAENKKPPWVPVFAPASGVSMT